MGKYYRLNERIQASELRVIDSKGGLLGILKKEDALAKAKKSELDLVEIAPNAKPPVAKILDFQKFKYEENKKEQAAKKKLKEVELKELWFSPRIAEHDLETRVRKAQQFIKEGNKVMVRIKFKGREMAHLNLGFELISKIKEMLGEKAEIDREPKVEGRSITVIIGKSKR